MTSSIKKSILVTERISEVALQLLRIALPYPVQHFAPGTSPTQLDLQNCCALLIRSGTTINTSILDRCPNLEVIVSATSGFDHIDFAATSQKNIKVMHTPTANVVSAAELTWSLLLACTKKLTLADQIVRQGDWRREVCLGSELSGKTYGVVGLGRIGRKVAAFAHSFGMNVLAFDPYIEEKVFIEHQVESVPFAELLSQSDFASFHVPRTWRSRHMISDASLALVKPGIVLINTSRGDVFSENATCAALLNGQIGALGLDVFENEPLSINSPILKFPNVLCSPHIGATTTEAFEKSSHLAVSKIIQFFLTGLVTDSLPPTEAWYIHSQT
jgi:D-3-phosphoglycerate dehydrogenase